MSSHADAHVKALSKQYSDEMGSLGQTFKAYLGKWSNAMLIDADLPGFVGETRDVICRIPDDHKDAC